MQRNLPVEKQQLEFKPFENDSQSLTLGPGDGLTFENSTEEIVVYGQLSITKKTKKKEIETMISLLEVIKQKLND